MRYLRVLFQSFLPFMLFYPSVVSHGIFLFFRHPCTLGRCANLHTNYDRSPKPGNPPLKKKTIVDYVLCYRKWPFLATKMKDTKCSLSMNRPFAFPEKFCYPKFISIRPLKTKPYKKYLRCATQIMLVWLVIRPGRAFNKKILKLLEKTCMWFAILYDIHHVKVDLSPV